MITLSGCRKGSSSPTAGQSGTSDNGVTPILLGKNFEEVTAIIGRMPDNTHPKAGITKQNWTYEKIPASGFALFLEFDDNGPDSGVDTGVWGSSSSYGDGDSVSVIKPTQVVPKNIWQQDPVGIYRSINIEAIVVHWRIENNEYIAVLQDANRKLFDVIRGLDDQGNLRVHCELTEAGRDFRSCDQISSFIYIKGEYDFFKPVLLAQDPTIGGYGRVQFQKF